MKYQIAEPNFKYAETKLSRIAKKALRLGHEISWDITGEKMIEWEDGRFINILTIEVAGTNPMLGKGWEYVATVQSVPTGNILRKRPDFTQDIPQRYRNSGTSCDHCNISRLRKDTYIIHNSGQFMQVGSSCINDFVGYKNDPKHIAQYYAGLDCLVEDFDHNESIGFSSEQFHYDIERILQLAFAEVQENGWVSTTKAMETYGLASTSDNVRSHLVEYCTYKIYANSSHRELAQKAIAFIRNMDLSNGNDYLSNLGTTFAMQEISWRQIGIVASAVSFYLREVGKEKEQESEWVYYPMPSKKRVNFENLTHVRTLYFGGQWGASYMNILKDANGNEIIWSTTSVDMGQDEGQWEGKATLKDHIISFPLASLSKRL